MAREFQEQLKQAQDQLQRAQKQLQQAQKQLRQAKEQLEDERIKRWENEGGSADGEHVLNTRERSRSLGSLSPPIQHPTDELVMVLLKFNGNDKFVTGYPAYLDFNVKGLVQAASYQIFVHARSELTDSWDLWGVKPLKMDSKSEIVTSIQLRPLYLVGDAWVRVVIMDMFPGLSPEDQALSHVRGKIELVEADKCDAAGQRYWNSKISTAHIAKYGWSSNPVNSESATAVLVTGSTARKRNWAVLVTVSSAFIDMFENWLYWYQLLALDMAIILIAEDQETFQKYESNGILETRLSKFFVFQDNVTFDFDSKDYKDLVSKRPSHILEVFKSHENIIYTDVDTVWLEDPRPYFSGDHDLWLSLDFEPDLNDFDPALLSFFDFCTGFMALLPTNGTMSILQEWELELVKKPQLNQPVFNHLLTKFKLSIGMLDRVRFPSGDIFFGEKNISTSILPASPLHVNVKKKHHAVVVHNNWIRGHANKVQRFKHKGLWWKDLPSYALSGAAFSRIKSNDSIAATSSGRDMLRNKLRRKAKEMMMAKTIASEPNSVILPRHVGGGEQDFVLPRGMQQSSAQVSFSIEEIRRVQETAGLCNLLIFGLGFDSVFWNDVNKLGSTVFLEDNQHWIDTVRKCNDSVAR
jgi:rhamnogalacturonan II specific xylosyltransferase